MEALKKHFPIVVGTPNRLNKLFELGALSFHQTKLFIFDLARDAKSFDLLTLPSITTDVWQLVSNMISDMQDGLVALLR